MRRYKLSENVRITGLDEIEEEDIPVRYRTGYFILSDGSRKREYLSNETIKYFVDKFSTPKSRLEIVAEVAADVKGEPQQVVKTCTSFIRYLRKIKILLPEKEKQHAAPEVPIYKQGDMINRYVVSSIIASKREIDIYRAVDQTNDRKCVIKLLNRNKLSQQKKYEKELLYLQREYSLLQKAKDVPSISKVYAFEQDKNGNMFIVLEMIEGKPIARFVNERNDLTKEDCVLLIRNMLEAFAQLHQNGTVHADVHSANVLVAEDKSVRIIDLGLSINKEIEENQVLKHGDVDYYMPPERINTSSVNKYTTHPDFFSDVYQIGLLMYVVLYHRLPFTGFIWEELSAAIKNNEAHFPDIAAAGFAVPQSLQNIIQKCIEKKPAKRYPNAAGILKEYVQYASDEKSFQVTNA